MDESDSTRSFMLILGEWLLLWINLALHSYLFPPDVFCLGLVYEFDFQWPKSSVANIT